MQERSLNDNFLSNLLALNNGKNSKRIEFLLYNVLKLDEHSFKQDNEPSIMESLFETQQENEEYDPVTGYNYVNTNHEYNKLHPTLENVPRFIYKSKHKSPSPQHEPSYNIRSKQEN